MAESISMPLETPAKSEETINLIEKIDLNERDDPNSEEKLKNLQENLLSLDSNNPHTASECIRIVREIVKITENLTGREKSSFGFTILDTAMARLENQFMNLLFHYKQSSVGLEIMSFRSTEEENLDFSNNSFSEDLIEGKTVNQNDTINVDSEQSLVDLIHPSVIPTLKSIAELLFLSKYEKELIQAYIGARIEAMDECLSALRFEKFSIEEILKWDWSKLNSLIKRWNWTCKLFVRVFLMSERRLSEFIFGEFSKSVVNSCFFDICKVSMLHLLSFGEAVCIAPPLPEKLFRVLDMYETLGEIFVDLESLFVEEFDGTILRECKEVLMSLGGFVKRTLMEFKQVIQSYTSRTAFARGGVHPMTRYVINYLKTLSAYNNTLEIILDGPDGKQQYFALVTAILESNLEGKSKLYKDESLQNIFMMNNICYMVQRVRDSELRKFLGDNWIRIHIKRFQQFEVSYERVSWGPVLSFLREEGIYPSGSNVPSKSVLKERFKGFNLGFEEAYRVQTGWSVPNVQLRDDLRISISMKVLQAYRTFVGRYADRLNGIRHRDRYIKYCPDDLEKYILDLFEGSEKSLQNIHRK